jgi:hypothetical protein
VAIIKLFKQNRKEQMLDRIEKVEKLEHSYIASGSVSSCSHCGKVSQLLNKLIIQLQRDPTILL